jgi:2-methylisocitrate lyase-like PEP mutase family enzyme
MSFAREQLRQLLVNPEIIVILGVYDGLGAKLAEKQGFNVIATSGFGIAASRTSHDKRYISRSEKPIQSQSKLEISVKSRSILSVMLKLKLK